MKNSYVFPAVFTREDNGYSVSFPDLHGLVTEGDDIDEAVYMAQDALEGRLYIDEKDGDIIPAPSDIYALQKTLKDNQAVSLIRADMEYVRARNSKKTVNKMITLPEWLDIAGKKESINFSKLMQKALMRELGIKDSPKH